MNILTDTINKKGKIMDRNRIFCIIGFILMLIAEIGLVYNVYREYQEKHPEKIIYVDDGRI